MPRRAGGWKPRAWGTPHQLQLVGARTTGTMVGVGALVFGVAALLVRTGRVSVDVRFYRELNQVPAWATAFLTPLSKLFLPLAIGVAVVLGGAYCVVRTRTLWPAAFGAAAAAAAWLGANLAKSVADRLRPYEVVAGAVLRQHPAHGSSFPSSHTAVAFAVAIAVIPYLPRAGVAVALSYAALVGWSRVFLGVHYPLDVFAGMGLGLAVGGVSLLLARRVHRSRRVPAPATSPPGE